jgi:hypothetical protein
MGLRNGEGWNHRALHLQGKRLHVSILSQPSVDRLSLNGRRMIVLQSSHIPKTGAQYHGEEPAIQLLANSPSKA